MTDLPVPTIAEVRDFWERHPCGNETASASRRLDYFREIERYRYESAPYIPRVARFEHYAGKRVLEIGCGMGTDGTRFAAAGADYVGVDLTESAAALTQENLSTRNLAGETRVVNAEDLPYEDASFDHVYSFGVIHHTRSPSSIIDELSRVLRPGGTVTVMLYNRTSINYYVEIMLIRRLARQLLRPSWAPRVLATVLRLSPEKLEGHRAQLLGGRRMSREQWISINTDGPDCPLARVYSPGEAIALFASFADVQTEVHFFDRTHWPFIKRVISDRTAETIGRRAGWHRMVYAVKPRT